MNNLAIGGENRTGLMSMPAYGNYPSFASSVFEVLFISKSLERVCDHAVNISKEIFFMATSRDIRHAPEYKKSALRKGLK